MSFINLTSIEDSAYSRIHLKWFYISELQSFIDYTDILDWTQSQKVRQGSEIATGVVL